MSRTCLSTCLSVLFSVFILVGCGTSNSPVRGTDAVGADETVPAMPGNGSTGTASAPSPMAVAGTGEASATSPTADATALAAIQTPTLVPSKTPVQPTQVPATDSPLTPQVSLPVIYEFAVSPTDISTGDEVTVSWRAEGDAARLCISWSGAYPPNCFPEPLSGSYTFTFDFVEGKVDIYLFVTGEAVGGQPAPQVSEVFSADLGCRYTWAFEVPADWGCPTPAEVYNAAAQPFEHGWMIWTGRESNSYLILLDIPFTGNGQAGEWQLETHADYLDIVRDTSAEVVAPEGFYAPTSGFGYLWRGDLSDGSGYRETLGWALKPEFNYQATYQCRASFVPGNSYCLINHPYSGVVELINSGITFFYWSYLGD